MIANDLRWLTFKRNSNQQNNWLNIWNNWSETDLSVGTDALNTLPVLYHIDILTKLDLLRNMRKLSASILNLSGTEYKNPLEDGQCWYFCWNQWSKACLMKSKNFSKTNSQIYFDIKTCEKSTHIKTLKNLTGDSTGD